MSDAAEALKLDTTKVRGGTGLDAIRDEVDEVLQSAFDTTKSAAEAFLNPRTKSQSKGARRLAGESMLARDRLCDATQRTDPGAQASLTSASTSRSWRNSRSRKPSTMRR